jgi:ATP-binding cassette subfamily B protein
VKLRPRKGKWKETWKYIPRVFPYLRPHWRLGTVSIGVTVLGALAGLLEPWPLAIIIDSVLGGHAPPGFISSFVGEGRVAVLVFIVVAGFLLVLIRNGLTVLNEYVNTKLDLRMVLDFRSDLFQHAQRLSMAFHDRSRTGNLLLRINYMSQAVGNVPLMFPPLGQSLITLIGMFLIASRIDAQLAWISLTVVPFIYYSIGYYSTRIQPRLLQVRQMEGDSLSIIHEAMSMIRVVIAFGREGHHFRRFRNQGERALDARVKLTVRQTLFSLAVNGITAAGAALVLGVGAYHVMQGKLTTGTLLVVLSYINSVYSPLEAISSVVGNMSEQHVSLRMAFELIDIAPEVKEAPHAVAIKRATGDLGFEEVHFNYHGRKITLKDVSFDVPAGQVVAIVGPTGAGKTTLVSLIPRFFDPKRGRITLDGTDIKSLTLASLRQQISIVLQEPLLFSGTILENIRYGRLDASDAELMEAAEAANAHDFITRLPQKYQTRLGERGAQLSTGERQRISIARAFLKDAPILILDEPTSSIDSRTEDGILRALHDLSIGRTTLMIAHRLSTVQHADRIIVVNGGQVIEQGTRGELLQRDGLYRELHEAQFGLKQAAGAQLETAIAGAPVPADGQRAARPRRQSRKPKG